MILYKALYFTCLYITLFLFKLFYRLKVYGKDHLSSGSAIIAANHISFFDPPLIVVACQKELHFLARHTLFKSTFGKILEFFHTHPIKKNATNISIIKHINELLKQGHKVVLFPEGMRSPDNELREIKPGIGVLIARSKAVIIPTYIHGAYDVWNRHRKFPKLFGKIVVVFGAPILWKDYADMERKEAHRNITQHLAHSISTLRKWYMNGAEGIPP